MMIALAIIGPSASHVVGIPLYTYEVSDGKRDLFFPSILESSGLVCSSVIIYVAISYVVSGALGDVMVSKRD